MRTETANSTSQMERWYSALYPRLSATLRNRHDPDWTHKIVSRVFDKWWDDIVKRGCEETAAEWLPLLFGTVLWQCETDANRERQREKARSAPEEAGESLAQATLSPESALIILQEAEPLLERLPLFFSNLDLHELTSRFRELRRLARMHGCTDLVDEYDFIQHYLFAAKASEEGTARRALTAELGWFQQKSGNAKSQALFRLRRRLQEGWLKARHAAFGDLGRPLPALA